MSLLPRYTEQDILQCKEDMFGEKEGGDHNNDSQKTCQCAGFRVWDARKACVVLDSSVCTGHQRAGPANFMLVWNCKSMQHQIPLHN